MLFFIIGAVALLLMFAGLFIVGSPKQKKKIKVKKGDVTQVVIEGENAKLTVKRNGLVEVETDTRSFYQHWDEKRVERLFSLLKDQDYSGYSNRLRSGESGYLVTISTTDGDIVIAITDFGDVPDGLDELIEILQEIEEEIDDEDNDGSGTDEIGFGSSPSPSSSPGSFPSPSISPSPTPGYSAYPTPTPTPVGEPEIDPQVPFSCELSDLDGGINILSETVCNLIN